MKVRAYLKGTKSNIDDITNKRTRETYNEALEYATKEISSLLENNTHSYDI